MHPLGAGSYTQSATALIFLWLLLGWLVPTLLLIAPSHSAQRTAQPAPAEQQQRQQGTMPRKHSVAKLLARWEAATEDWLRLLLPTRHHAGADGCSTLALCCKSWLLAVKSLWLASCCLATLYAAPNSA